jgi:hypothetical protein
MLETTPYLVREGIAVSSTARVDVFCARPDIVSHYNTFHVRFGPEPIWFFALKSYALVDSHPGEKKA